MTVSFGRLAAAALLLAVAGCNKPASETATATSPAGPADVSKDWTKVVATTADGGYRIGNPDADVKLVEYASVWCPHCKEFHEKGMDKLKATYIATGKVSYERRDFILNGPDLAATLLVQCNGLPRYWQTLEVFYKRQQDWEMKFINLTEPELKPIQALPQADQMMAYAKAAKLDDFVRPLGITAAKFNQCLLDKAATDKLTASNSRAIKDFNVNGTPTFIINGVTLENTASWEALEPKLKAAL